MMESDSASRAREARSQSVEPLSDCVAKGPAANANRYVGMRLLGANCTVTPRGTVSYFVAAPFDNARQPVGTVSARPNSALRSGWSKQGKRRLASAGTSSVYRYSRLSVSSVNRMMLAPAGAIGDL